MVETEHDNSENKANNPAIRFSKWRVFFFIKVVFLQQMIKFLRNYKFVIEFYWINDNSCDPYGILWKYD